MSSRTLGVCLSQRWRRGLELSKLGGRSRGEVAGGGDEARVLGVGCRVSGKGDEGDGEDWAISGAGVGERGGSRSRADVEIGGWLNAGRVVRL